jgi:hypothetical protein
MAFLWSKFGVMKELENMQFASDDADCIPIYYPDAVQWVLRVLAHNKELSPTLDLDEAGAAVIDYLRSTELSTIGLANTFDDYPSSSAMTKLGGSGIPWRAILNLRN